MSGELTPECPPACATLLKGIARYPSEHASGCVHYRNPYGRAWCRACRAMRQVVDESVEYQYRGPHEYAYRVQWFECDHSNQSDEKVVGPSPGGGAAQEEMTQRRTQDRLRRAAAWQEGES